MFYLLYRLLLLISISPVLKLIVSILTAGLVSPLFVFVLQKVSKKLNNSHFSTVYFMCVSLLGISFYIFFSLLTSSFF